MPWERASQLFAFRPEIYSIIVDRQGALAAYSSFFPLKRDYANAFIAGDLTEPELQPSMMLAREDFYYEAYFYVGSVVVVGERDPLTKAALPASLGAWRIQQMQASAMRRLTVIMLAATQKGHALIRFARAKPLASMASRKDGMTLYRRRASMGFVHRAASMLGRLINGSLVHMDLNFSPEISR